VPLVVCSEQNRQAGADLDRIRSESVHGVTSKKGAVIITFRSVSAVPVPVSMTR
jgi:hypothetical protein